LQQSSLPSDSTSSAISFTFALPFLDRGPQFDLNTVKQRPPGDQLAGGWPTVLTSTALLRLAVTPQLLYSSPIHRRQGFLYRLKRYIHPCTFLLLLLLLLLGVW
jgi:hypothetical protein